MYVHFARQHPSSPHCITQCKCKASCTFVICRNCHSKHILARVGPRQLVGVHRPLVPQRPLGALRDEVAPVACLFGPVHGVSEREHPLTRHNACNSHTKYLEKFMAPNFGMLIGHLIDCIKSHNTVDLLGVRRMVLYGFIHVYRLHE